jgi:hypothetical protein
MVAKLSVGCEECLDCKCPESTLPANGSYEVLEVSTWRLEDVDVTDVHVGDGSLRVGYRSQGDEFTGWFRMVR